MVKKTETKENGDGGTEGVQRCVMRDYKLKELKKRIDHEAAAAAHHSKRWHAAYEWHMDRFMKACKERDELLNA